MHLTSNNWITAQTEIKFKASLKKNILLINLETQIKSRFLGQKEKRLTRGYKKLAFLSFWSLGKDLTDGIYSNFLLVNNLLNRLDRKKTQKQLINYKLPIRNRYFFHLEVKGYFCSGFSSPINRIQLSRFTWNY